MSKFGFGELESAIVNILHDKQRMTVRDVYRALGEKGSYTTIMTVMSRLAEKGELMREKEGRGYVYWLTERSQSSAMKLLKRIEEKVFRGEPTAMMSFLLEENKKLTEKELSEIEEMIRKKREEFTNG